MNGLLRVDSQELASIAGRLQEDISKLNNAYTKIDQIVNKSQRLRPSSNSNSLSNSPAN